MYLDELGANIHYFRRLKGFTQSMLAEQLHVSTQAISSWEKGKTYPDLENLCRLSEVLSVNVDKLLMSCHKNNETYMIGVDGGGTKAEIVLFSSVGSIEKVIKLPGTNASVKGVSEVVAILRQGIDLCLEIQPTSSYVYIGNAGSYLNEIEIKLKQIYPDISFCVVSDAVNALKCVDNADGAMILGTGTNLVKEKEDGYHFVGGWGSKLGDPGSGFNFGREACKIARAYYDGVHQDAMIYSLVKEKLGTESILNVGRLSSSQIAQFATAIFEADRNGDERARKIISDEMQELSKLVKALLPNGGRMAAVGGVVECFGQQFLPLLRELTEDKVDFIVPKLSPVYGACRACMEHFCIVPDDEFSNRYEKQYATSKQEIV